MNMVSRLSGSTSANFTHLLDSVLVRNVRQCSSQWHYCKCAIALSLITNVTKIRVVPSELVFSGIPLPFFFKSKCICSSSDLTSMLVSNVAYFKSVS